MLRFDSSVLFNGAPGIPDGIWSLEFTYTKWKRTDKSNPPYIFVFLLLGKKIKIKRSCPVLDKEMRKPNHYKVITILTLSIISFFSFSFPFLSFCDEDEEFYARRRKEMVQRQLKARDISDQKVLEAMETVPRHLFVSPQFRDRAYEDYPLPIDEGQTISQPYIVALMTQYLDLKRGEKVLEIGTGSGYQAAVLAHLTDKVYSIEIREKLAQKAEETLKDVAKITGMPVYNQVRIKWDDGYFGWEEHAPFDAIIVTCASNHIPPPLLDQLKEGGRLIIPIGSTLYFQTLDLVRKKKDRPQVRHVLGVRFVPMVGEAQKKKD
jgi:protein-L-isoaspartate(D-aspartate) O-methyltransferase